MITYELVKRKLKEGMIISNYKELCKILEIKALTSNSKKAQLKQLQLYCNYKKEGNKFIIMKIYDIPKLAIDNRGKATKSNHSKYIKDITDILINYIYNNQNIEGYVILSFSKLINILGLVNNTYTIGNSKKKELSDILNISLQGVNFFYKESRNEFKNIVNRSLKHLKDKKVLKYDEKIMICEEIEDDNGKIIKHYRLATETEEKFIMEAQYNALQKLGAEKENDLIYLGYNKYKEYNKYIFEELKKPILNDYGIDINPMQYWLFFYKVYKIQYGTNAIQNEHKKIIDTKKSLNQKSIDRINKLFALKDTNETEEEILINNLIDIDQYNINLDDKLLEEYKNNKEYYYNKALAEAIESEKYRNLSNETLEEWKNKDDIEEIEILKYKSKVKKRKRKILKQ